MACFLSLSLSWDDFSRTRVGNWHANDEISVLHCCAQAGINRFLMKGLLLFFILSAAFAHGLFASDSLPFPVSLGGQAPRTARLSRKSKIRSGRMRNWRSTRKAT
jgi:hypothetical protein